MWRLYFFFIKHKTIILDRLKHILLVFALSIQQFIFAQTNSSINDLNIIDKKLNESIYISTNANSFLTGETLFYKIFCMDRSTNIGTKFSKVAYVQLVDSNKKTILTHKVFLNNATGSGDFFIPTTLETGNYKLIGYTNWMLNKEASGYFNIDIYIVNPYKENPSDVTATTEVSQPNAEKNENIFFELKNKSFNSREQIELGIKTNLDEYAKGSYMLSVRKADGFTTQKKQIFASLNNDSYNEIKSAQIVLPELRGEIITGKISSKTAEIKNKKVALSIVAKNYDLKIVKTDDQGRFTFNLEKSNSNSNIIIQIIEDNKQDYEIEIDKPKDIDFSKLTFPGTQFNADFKKIITDRLISSQIENAYYDVKKDSITESKATTPFYGLASEEFIFDSYTRFPNIEETITEIIKGVYYRKNNNIYSIHVFDNDENYESSLPALITVDGLILDNLNEFFAYNPKNLYKVNVVRGIYYYGAKSFNGIVAFTTKNGDYETKLSGKFVIRPELIRPLAKKEYFQPDYKTSKNTRIPDYRHQLLWMPEIDLSKPNSAVTFQTSDISGKFEIVLEGFSSSGKPVYITETFEVKDPISN